MCDKSWVWKWIEMVVRNLKMEIGDLLFLKMNLQPFTEFTTACVFTMMKIIAIRIVTKQRNIRTMMINWTQSITVNPFLFSILDRNLFYSK